MVANIISIGYVLNFVLINILLFEKKSILTELSIFVPYLTFILWLKHYKKVVEK